MAAVLNLTTLYRRERELTGALSEVQGLITYLERIEAREKEEEAARIKAEAGGDKKEPEGENGTQN